MFDCERSERVIGERSEALDRVKIGLGLRPKRVKIIVLTKCLIASVASECLASEARRRIKSSKKCKKYCKMNDRK